MAVKVKLVSILHCSPTIPAFDVEDRNDVCGIEVLSNGSLAIDYLDRDGERITSKIVGIHPEFNGNQGLFVMTLNSIYVFEHADGGKYDYVELADRLSGDMEVYASMRKAIGSFFEAFR